MSQIPDWFWSTIQGAEKQLLRLEETLESFERQKLEDFWGHHEVASSDLVDYEAGVWINESLGYLSEDGTEDHCDWIVSMGKEYWEDVMEGRRSHPAVFQDREDSRKGLEAAPTRWDIAVKNPAYRGFQGTKWIAIPMLEERFGVDFYDIRDDILRRVGYWG